jgi:hypothetical protein
MTQEEVGSKPYKSRNNTRSNAEWKSSETSRMKSLLLNFMC